MAKYRKKYIDIEAFLWDGFDGPGLDKFIHGEDGTENPKIKVFFQGLTPVYVGNAIVSGTIIQIQNCNGLRVAAPGDYIVKTPTGCVYPLCPESFNMSYEPVEE